MSSIHMDWLRGEVGRVSMDLDQKGEETRKYPHNHHRQLTAQYLRILLYAKDAGAKKNKKSAKRDCYM